MGSENIEDATSSNNEKTVFSLFLNDLICGSFAGVVNCCSGHPLDSMKVRMQTDKQVDITFRKVIKDTYKLEGVMGFYKGMASPLFMVPLINAIVFSSYESCKRFMGVGIDQSFTFNQSIVSGMFAGFVNSFFLSPIELVKCRLQIQREEPSKAYYKGPIDCIKRIIKEEGTSGLYKGLFSTITREVPCYAGQFGGYYLARQLIAKQKGCDMSDLGPIHQFFAGAFGGFTCWLVSYPQDVIKTTLQVEKSNQFHKYHRFIPDGGIINCAKYIYINEGGWHGFWRGFSACSARAIISNSFMFVAYEYAQKQTNILID